MSVPGIFKLSACLCFVLIALPGRSQFTIKSPASTIEDAARASVHDRSVPEDVVDVSGLTVVTNLHGFAIRGYARNVSNAVRGRWTKLIRETVSDPNNRTGKITVEFTVERSGDTTNVAVIDSSGASDLDESAKQTIIRASPFAPLPSGLKVEHLVLRFHFEFRGKKGCRK